MTATSDLKRIYIFEITVHELKKKITKLCPYQQPNILVFRFILTEMSRELYPILILLGKYAENIISLNEGFF